NASIKEPAKQNTMYFEFSDKHRQTMLAKVSSKKRLALQAVISVPSGNGQITLGLMNKGQGENEYVSVSEVISPSIEFDRTKNVTLSLCFDPQKPVPTGMYVTSSLPCSLDSVSFTDAIIGVDFENNIYASGPSGGEVNPLSIDFSDGKKIFDTSMSENTVLPKIEIGVYPQSPGNDMDKPSSSTFFYGPDSFELFASPSQHIFTLQTACMTEPFAALSEDGQKKIYSAFMSANSADEYAVNEDGFVTKGFVCDLGFVFEWPQERWRCRDYGLYVWEEFPEVLIFDFRNYKVQNEFFTRLAYFVEKNGYKGTLVGDDFVRDKHGYNAHDYKGDDLARFFTLVSEKKFRINEREKILKQILLDNGIILNNGDGTYSGGKGAVISIARESTPELRKTLMAHESWHGIYFTDAGFRDYVSGLYDAFDKTSMEFLRTYFSVYPSLQYDIRDDYLMHNEFMAYHLQQSVSATGPYFKTRASWNTIASNNPAACNYVIRNDAKDFTETSRALSQYVFEHWGFKAGSTELVERK
ncbi:MAG: hypothetical protein J5857_12605, partial [Treponema sp.]|nr:hypothetical protein [Treponema sp.]